MFTFFGRTTVRRLLTVTTISLVTVTMPRAVNPMEVPVTRETNSCSCQQAHVCELATGCVDVRECAVCRVAPQASLSGTLPPGTDWERMETDAWRETERASVYVCVCVCVVCVCKSSVYNCVCVFVKVVYIIVCVNVKVVYIIVWWSVA